MFLPTEQSRIVVLVNTAVTPGLTSASSLQYKPMPLGASPPDWARKSINMVSPLDWARKSINMAMADFLFKQKRF